MRKKFLLLIFLIITFTQVGVSQSPGDYVFNSAIIHDINITMNQPNWWDSLLYYKRHADTFNLSTQAMMGHVTIDGTLVDSVGISLKGNSSFGYPGMKKPIKIEFNQYVSGKKYDGLKTINLNNNAIDPTHMREKLLLDYLNSQGLSAPRCNYARVSYNGSYVGLYKVVEQIDKTFLKTHFGNSGGNLFKGDPQGSLMWLGSSQAAYYTGYELHTNETVNNWSDLVNFIDNINNTPSANFKDTLETLFNSSSFIKQWAAENLFVDLDSYFHAPHNYYLYHNTSTNKFEWINWDVSVAFGFYPYMTEAQTISTPIFSSAFPLTNNLLANSVYKTDYLNAICSHLDNFSNTALNSKIDSIGNAIYPSILAEPDSNQMFPEQMFYACLDSLTFVSPIGEVPGLKRFIAKRRSDVIAQLAATPFICTNELNEIKNPKENVLIYPNPFDDTFFISFELFKEEDISIQLYNVFGQKVGDLVPKASMNKGSYRIAIDDAKYDLATGVYLILFQTSQGQQALKLIKKQQ